jgi:hypothetical protein
LRKVDGEFRKYGILEAARRFMEEALFSELLRVSACALVVTLSVEPLADPGIECPGSRVQRAARRPVTRLPAGRRSEMQGADPGVHSSVVGKDHSGRVGEGQGGQILLDSLHSVSPVLQFSGRVVGEPVVE